MQKLDGKGLLDDIYANRPRAHEIKDVKFKIQQLKQQVAAASVSPTAEDIHALTKNQVLEKSDRPTKRMLWRARKRAAKTIESFNEQKELVSELNVLLHDFESQLQELEATEAAELERVESLRKRREEVEKKKRALVQQLQDEDKKTARNTSSKKAKTVKTRKMKEMSSDLGDILDEAVTVTSKASRMENNARWKIDDVAPMTSLFESGDDYLEKRTNTGASTTPPAWPSSANYNQEPHDQLQPSFEDYDTTKAPRKPSDSLRLNVPASGKIYVDAALTVSLNTSISDLQSQIFHMQERLKSSYPRIDTLPYDIWNSTNRNTLQTWLKIMITRWQNRFDNVGKDEARLLVDQPVKLLLDQMVRDHDLSNEAAERMALRWNDVINQRGAMTGDAAGKIDWDEFDAGGMGFLMDGEGEERRSVGRLKVMGGGGRRFYCTNSRSALDAGKPPTSPSQSPSSTSTSTPTSTSPSPSPTQSSLPHLTPTGSAHMVSVSSKPHTTRTATAIGTVYFSNPTPLTLIRSNALKKGDVLSVSRIAGIMAAKKCPDLVPLCHPIALEHVGVELKAFDPRTSITPTKEKRDGRDRTHADDAGHGGVSIEATVQCTGPTGVEMEALTSVMGTALSVVDMCKAVDKGMRIGGVRVVVKEGGRSGGWREEGWVSWQG
jgi:molybdenum cofactor biosynthesis protein MoaC